MPDFPLPLRRVRTLVDDSAYEREWRPAVQDSGSYFLEIDAAGVTDAEAFFERASVGLGLGEDAAVHKFSGLEDRIYEALAVHQADSGVIVLRHSDSMVGPLLGDLLEAVDVFGALVRAVGEDRTGSFPRDVALFVLLTGTGPSFPGHLG